MKRVQEMLSDYLREVHTEDAKEFREQYKDKIKVGGFINPSSCFGDVWYKITDFFMYCSNPYYDSVYYWDSDRKEKMSVPTYHIRRYSDTVPVGDREC